MTAKLFLLIFLATCLFFKGKAFAKPTLAYATEDRSVYFMQTRIEHPVDLKEDPGPSPGPDYMWIKGHWRWNDVDWVWVKGRWIKRPSQNAVWIPGYWFRKNHHWIWVEGRWK